MSERLEIEQITEVVKREIVIAKSLGKKETVNLPIDIVMNLIQQAERVEELEKENEAYLFDIDHAKYHRVISDNQRYKQILKDIRDVSRGTVHRWADQALKGELE